MASFKVHGGSFGSGTGTLFLGQLSLPKGRLSSEVVPSSDLAAVEVVTEANKKKVMGTLGGGAAGFLLLGPLGAIGGMMVGGNKREITFVGSLRDGRNFVATADTELFAKLKAIASNSVSEHSVGTESLSLRQGEQSLPPDIASKASDVIAQVKMMFDAMGWKVAEVPKRPGSRHTIVHAVGPDEALAIAFTEDRLNDYNLGLIYKAICMAIPDIRTVIVGRSLSGDGKIAAQKMGISVGEVAETLTLIESALSGEAKTKPPKRKAGFFSFFK